MFSLFSSVNTAKRNRLDCMEVTKERKNACHPGYALHAGAQLKAVLTRGAAPHMRGPVAVVTETAPEPVAQVVLPPARPQKLLGLRAQLGLI